MPILDAIWQGAGSKHPSDLNLSCLDLMFEYAGVMEMARMRGSSGISYCHWPSHHIPRASCSRIKQMDNLVYSWLLMPGFVLKSNTDHRKLRLLSRSLSSVQCRVQCRVQCKVQCLVSKKHSCLYTAVQSMQVHQIPEKQPIPWGMTLSFLEKDTLSRMKDPCSCHQAVRSLESQDGFQNRSG